MGYSSDYQEKFEKKMDVFFMELESK
ncbi:hypothetical protein A3Q56_08211, partial [Intoshia linei]